MLLAWGGGGAFDLIQQSALGLLNVILKLYHLH